MKHVLSCDQFTRESLEELFNLADDVKQNMTKYSNALQGKVVAAIFYEPSTRTRLSFETAILRLGAKVIATENANANSSATKGETLEDTIRIIQGYADAIVIRHFKDHAAEEAAKVAKVPILNAGSGRGEHPSQALLDMYTIRSKKGKIDGIKVAILGDLKYGRTIHSLLKLLCLYNDVEVYSLSKEAFALTDDYITLLAKHNIKFTKCSSFDELPHDIDIMYHTRIQSERFEGDFGKEEFIINKEILGKFSSETYVMHPLPRVNEISDDVDEDKRVIFFEQAHNGLLIRMSLLLKVFGKDK